MSELPSQDPSDVWARGYQDGRAALMEAFRVLDRDGHQWSTRPCKTCALVTSVTGTAFGCIRFANERRP